MRIPVAHVAALCGILAVAPGTTRAEEAGRTATLSEADRRAVVADVLAHLRDNPGQVAEMLLSWRQRSMESVQLLSPDDPSSGNPEGDVIVVEFPDLGCGACRRVSADLEAAAAEDGRVRLIHKDLPRGGEAKQATLMLLASTPSGKMRASIMGTLPPSGPIGVEAMSSALVAAGVGPATGDGIDRARDLMARNAGLAAKIGIDGAPALVVMAGDKVQVLTGDRGRADILASIRSVRAAARTP